MRKLNLLIALLIFTINITAQDVVATKDDIDKFFKSKTYVVFDENIFGNYNSHIKQAVEEQWTATEFEFIDIKQYNKLRGNYKASFIIRTRVNFEKDKSETDYTFLSLLLGSNKASSMSRMPDLCSFPLSYYNVDYDKYTYKLGAIISFMQNHVQLLKNNSNINSKNVLKYYNKNKSELAGKTLYVIEDELANDCNTLSKIKNFYSGKVVITTQEEINKIISSKDKDAVFLHKVGPSSENQKMRIYKLILGTDGKLYYFDYHKYNKEKAPDAFLSKDFKSL
ncbi:MAG: hypothetical protein JXA16_05945 [Bacteroidales bacterium]|nr:hypothetical protein [Bacteroidales bacterium]